MRNLVFFSGTHLGKSLTCRGVEEHRIVAKSVFATQFRQDGAFNVANKTMLAIPINQSNHSFEFRLALCTRNFAELSQ